MQHEKVYLGLGSNVGDREALLSRAVALLELRGFHVTKRSALYETEPVGGPVQGPFLNAVLGGTTALSPEDLLAQIAGIEAALGRVRLVHHGPRTLDVDLLLYGDVVRDTPALTLPHPRLHERRFVLVPLAEIDPQLRHPLLGRSAAELLAACPDRSPVVLWQPQGAQA